MKEETILEMARKAGCGHESMTRDWIAPEGLTSFAKLVEQATLERAAKKFRENAELCADWMVRTKSMYLDGADVLDALKDSHE